MNLFGCHYNPRSSDYPGAVRIRQIKSEDDGQSRKV